MPQLDTTTDFDRSQGHVKKEAHNTRGNQIRDEQEQAQN
jgi:hypothetical protein